MKNDFSQGSVGKIIMNQAIPLILAQMVQLLYNVVDRIYIGHLPGTDNLALTGIGLVFPITTLIAAFTNLFSTGGTPLFSIARGAKKEDRAKNILGNTFILIVYTSVVLAILCYIFRKPVLYLFGASDDTYGYADAYLRIYLIGTTFSMVSTGMNGFISAQGYPRFGMITTVIGAFLNLLLDPIFIFGFHMGVSGAALATVLSQGVSAVWVIYFLTKRQGILNLERKSMAVQKKLAGEICTLGLAGFMVQGTNCLVQVVCNIMLGVFGGDTYIGIITIINSVRDIGNLPIHGLTSGAQPVIGYNYGAKQYERVKQGIRFMGICGIIYTVIFWAAVLVKPDLFIRIFTPDPEFIEKGISAMKIYFFGFCFMALQFTGQATFTGLGFSRRAIFFSLLRKAIIVVPLTILLPYAGLGVDGVFWAEPISNLIGGTACFATMYFTVYQRMGKDKK